jgi:hypothetical protein
MSLKSLRWVIIVTTLVTAAIHLGLATRGPALFTALFVLNGVGYIVLLLAYLGRLAFLHVSRGVIYWAYMAFTAVTILAYFLLSSISPIGLVDKAVELVLLVALYLSMRAEQRQPAA